MTKQHMKKVAQDPEAKKVTDERFNGLSPHWDYGNRNPEIFSSVWIDAIHEAALSESKARAVKVTAR
jgi:hypothetical protein